MDLFLQTLINGILIGGVYILVAIGFSLCFGVMHVIDFSVGEWLMLGGFLGVVLVGWLNVDPLVLIPGIFAVFFVLGYLLQPVIQRVISGKRAANPALMGLVFTFGIHIFLQGFALTVWGHNRVSLSNVFVGEPFALQQKISKKAMHP